MTVEVVRGSLPSALKGRFKPWSIDAGHSKVLLRGFLADFESEDLPRIFDVLFQDVSRISIADRYEGLHLAVAEKSVMSLEESRVGADWSGSKMFILSRLGDCDYIVAGFLFWAEVAVRANSPSPLFEESPAPGSIVGKIFKVG
ncbi:hypothetical protein [Lentzea aerocolonigenes]|uniref:hypothetical protein n=1 Tax=Lentzea aerocolonigenes TaxID=68170 RepID=UPI0012DD6D33|nr:hypothetical protein [Lentzea aerocolonigenes]